MEVYRGEVTGTGEPGPVRVEFEGPEMLAGTKVTVLCHDGEKVGPVEPWMVRFLEAEEKSVLEDGYPGLARKHKIIAAALAQILGR